MSRCLLVGAAPCEHKALAYLLEKGSFDFVIAVDGGYETLCQKDIHPNVVFGDFDSLEYQPQHEHMYTFDTHKDFTDLNIALKYACRHDFDDIVVCDAFVGRLDHTIGNLQLLASAAIKGFRVWGFTEEEGILCLCGPGNFSEIRFSEGAKGTFSLLSHSDECTGVSEAGFEYGLQDATVLNRTPWGISNELIGKPAHASCEHGSLWAFYPLQVLSCVLYGKDAHKLL